MGETLPLVLVAAIWAGYNTTASSYKRLIQRRNIILTGKIGDEKIPLELRKHMLAYDWRPEWIAAIVANVAFVLAILLASQFVDLRNQNQAVNLEKQASLFLNCCRAFSLFPFLAILGWLISGYNDQKYMGKVLDKATDAEKKDATDAEKRTVVA
jgi:hypothetical protein